MTRAPTVPATSHESCRRPSSANRDTCRRATPSSRLWTGAAAIAGALTLQLWSPSPSALAQPEPPRPGESSAIGEDPGAAATHEPLRGPGDRIEGADGPPSEALEFYERGRAHYRAGRYVEAIDDLERALVLDPDSPTLNFNLARVHELAGRIDSSLGYYRRYLRLIPGDDAAERDRIEATIARLEGARHQRDSARETPTASAPPLRPSPQTPSHGVADAPFWILVGTTLVAGAAAGVMATLAVDREVTAQGFVLGTDGSWDDRARHVDDAYNFALAADILIGSAALTALGAILLYALRVDDGEMVEQAVASAAPSRDDSPGREDLTAAMTPWFGMGAGGLVLTVRSP